MTAEPGLAGDLHGIPAWTPAPTELADLELLLSGALAPLTGFLGAADSRAVLTGGTLVDGSPWPVPVTLTAPTESTDPSTEERLVLQDPEGVPLALLTVTETWQDYDGSGRLAGPVEPLRSPAHGPFHGMRRRPEEVRAQLPAGPVLAVTTRSPLHRRRLGQLRHVAERLEARVLVLALLGGEHDDALIRALLAVPKELPAAAMIVPLPLWKRPDPRHDLLLRARVAATYGATHLLDDHPTEDTAIPSLAPEPWAYDTEVEVWRPVSKIEPDHLRPDLTEDKLTALLDTGEPIPEWFTPPAVAAELRRVRPPRHERGLTVFFTGLSGSGKSTIARGLADALIEHGGRRVTLLDGDVVRRLLSAGLTFAKADRDLNIRRIGYVAAEVTRHGGTAICAPIAPYAATRAEVRRMVTAAGDFVLVHVATPLAECERRDRKGLYAKARAGLIGEFTGISDPYEEPDDADFTLDTTNLTAAEAVNKVLEVLIAGGWVAFPDAV